MEEKKRSQVKMYFVDLSEQANFAIGKLLSAQSQRHEADKRAIFEEIENKNNNGFSPSGTYVRIPIADWQALKKKFGC